MNDNYPPTPELDKMKACQDESQTIGSFLDWLYTESKYTIAEELVGSWSSELVPAHTNIEKLLAEYFNVDLQKVSAEKDAVYEWMCAQNEKITLDLRAYYATIQP